MNIGLHETPITDLYLELLKQCLTRSIFGELLVTARC